MHGTFRRAVTLFTILGATVLSAAAARAENHRSIDHCTREDAQNASPGATERTPRTAVSVPTTKPFHTTDAAACG